MDSPNALYVHIPFCATKCPYCDFNTYAGIEVLMDPYLAALRTEIGIWGKELGPVELETVFFGGGTPSYLPQGAIASLISKIRDSFDLGRSPEITLEANPDDLTEKKLESFLVL